MATPSAEKIAVENFVQGGRVSFVDAAKYQAAREALLKALPRVQPGLTIEELYHAMVPHLPEKLFPQAKGAVWWTKTAQLDLESKGLIVRDGRSPMRLCKI